MGESSGTLTDGWRSRPVPADLAKRYRAEGWWTDATLGDHGRRRASRHGRRGVPRALEGAAVAGTFADVDRAARSLAAALRARGVGPGDVVVFQLPNWVEAGITFWAAAYLGAVVVPIVHFYGAKEVDYILARPCARRRRHRQIASVAPTTWPSTSRSCADRPGPLWLVVGDTADGELPAGATAFASMLDGDPVAAPAPVDPDAPALIGFTSGTTRNPKGVVHSHRTIGFETRQLDYMFPTGGPRQITGAPVGHFIGMLNAFLVPLLRERPVNLDRRVGPGRDPAHDARRGPRRRAAAPPTS